MAARAGPGVITRSSQALASGAPMPILTLLTDFGTVDYYLAAVKGTVLRLAPVDVQLVDLGHEVTPGDVEEAADLLAAAAPAFPEGTCHLAVVDPGVGSERRILAVETGGQRFLAPDNGLLTWVLVGAPQGEWRAWSVTRRELFLAAPGATFHGRDRFAPVAAAWLRGETSASLGPEISDPVLLELPRPERRRADGGSLLVGRVRRVDRFGNLVTDVPVDWLGEGSERRGWSVEVAGHSVQRWVEHYAELPAGEPGALFGSLGTVELSLRQDNLASRWRVGRGAEVKVTRRVSPG